MTRSERSAMVVVAALAASAGLGLRWLAASRSLTGAPADHVAGVATARSIAGGEITWFIEGGTAPRAGSLGALFLGALMRLLGEETAVIALSIGIGVLAAMSTVLVVRRRLAGPWPFVAAAIWTSGSAVWMSAGSDPTDPIVVTTLLGMTLVSITDREGAPRWWAIGLILGLGWWTSPLMIVAAVPAVAMLLGRRVAPGAGGWAQVGTCAVLGALPRLIDDIRSGLPAVRSLAAWPDDPGGHLRSRPLAIIGAALGLSADDGTWLLPAGEWVAAVVITVLVLTAATVLVRQPRSRSALLLAVPAVVLVDLIGDGWGSPAGALSVLIGPATAMTIVIALSAAPARARPSAAIIVMIAATLLGTAGIVLEGHEDAQAGVTDDRTASSAAAKASVE